MDALSHQIPVGLADRFCATLGPAGRRVKRGVVGALDGLARARGRDRRAVGAKKSRARGRGQFDREETPENKRKFVPDAD